MVEALKDDDNADEVRTLTERTTRATIEISEMIKAIRKETRDAVIAMEQGVQQAKVGTVESGQSTNFAIAQLDATSCLTNVQQELSSRIRIIRCRIEIQVNQGETYGGFARYKNREEPERSFCRRVTGSQQVHILRICCQKGRV